MTAITPDMIETDSGPWWDSFGRMETEISAKLFVRACKKAGSWTVTKIQLDKEDSSGVYLFNGLDRGTWISTDNGSYTATERFIAYVREKFPAS